MSAISIWNDQVCVLVGCFNRHVFEVESLAIEFPQYRWFWPANVWHSNVDASALSENQILSKVVSLIEFRFRLNGQLGRYFFTAESITRSAVVVALILSMSHRHVPRDDKISFRS